MSESVSLVSEEEEEEFLVEIIEEYILDDEDETEEFELLDDGSGSDRYEIASCSDEKVSVEVEFEAPPLSPVQIPRRQSDMSMDILDMNIGEDDDMSCDDLSEAEERQKQRISISQSQRSSRSSSSRKSNSSRRSYSSQTTNSSDDGFDLTLPHNTNMENWQMSGITLMDFQQSQMMNLEGSYFFELVDTDEEEELEAAPKTESTDPHQEMNQLSLNPYRAAMDKVRGGAPKRWKSTGRSPVGKRRSMGAPSKQRSTPMNPARQVTEFLQEEARRAAAAATNNNYTPTRVAPARTPSGMRRGGRRRSYIKSPILEDQPHTPSNNSGSMRRKQRANQLLPNFSKEAMAQLKEEDKEDQHSTPSANHNNKQSDVALFDLSSQDNTKEPNSTPQQDASEEVKPPPESIVRNKSNYTEISAKKENNDETMDAEPPEPIVRTRSGNTLISALTPPRVKEIEIKPTDDDGSADDPPESILRTKSGNTDISALTPLPPRGGQETEETTITPRPLQAGLNTVLPAPESSMNSRISTDDNGNDQANPLLENDDDDVDASARITTATDTTNTTSSTNAIPLESTIRTRTEESEETPLTFRLPQETKVTPAVHARGLRLSDASNVEHVVPSLRLDASTRITTGTNTANDTSTNTVPLESTIRTRAEGSEETPLTFRLPEETKVTPAVHARKHVLPPLQLDATGRIVTNGNDSETSPSLTPPPPPSRSNDVAEMDVDIATSQRMDTEEEDDADIAASQRIDTDDDEAAPLKSIIPRTKSGTSEMSPLTASGHPMRFAKMEGVDKVSEMDADIAGSQRIDNDDDEAAGPLRSIIPRTKSGNSEMSPLTASGHPRRFAKMEGADKVPEMDADITVSQRIDYSQRNESIGDSVISSSLTPGKSRVKMEDTIESELSPTTTSHRRRRRRRPRGSNKMQRNTRSRDHPEEEGDDDDASIPKEAIARTRSDNSEESSLTHSGRPTRVIEMEPQSPSRRVPARTITASKSVDSEELSPLTASGHARLKFEANHITSPTLTFDSSELSPPLPAISQLPPIPMSQLEESPVKSGNSNNKTTTDDVVGAPKNDQELGYKTAPSKMKRRRSKDSGDTDRRLLHGIVDDDASITKVDLGQILEIQIPTDFKMSRSQDSFSTLDSESLAEDKITGSNRFGPSQQHVAKKRGSDVSPIPPMRPVTSPKLDVSERSWPEVASRGHRKTPLSELEKPRRRSLDLDSETEQDHVSWMDNSDSMIGSSTMNSTSRRNYMRRDLSKSSFKNNSRRNLAKGQSNFPNSSKRNLMGRQTSVLSFGNSGSRRNLMGSRQSSRRSSMDESPSMPRRSVATHVENSSVFQTSPFQMSMSSLASQSRASREKRSKIPRDQSPMRPRRTLDKVVSPGVKLVDDESLSDGSSANEGLPKEFLSSDSLPQSMRGRDVSPVRPRRTISSMNVPIPVKLLNDDDDSESSPKLSFPKVGDSPIPNEMDDDSRQEKKELEMPITTVPDYIPPLPPLPSKGIPIEQLNARRTLRQSAIQTAAILDIDMDEESEDSVSPLPDASRHKGVKIPKESRSPTEAASNTKDSEYQPSLDKQSPAMPSSEPVSEVEKGTKTSPFPSERSQISTQSLVASVETIKDSPMCGEGAQLNSSSDIDSSFRSAASTRKRAQARVNLEKLNSKIASTFGVGLKTTIGTGSKSPAVAASPAPPSAPESRKTSLEMKRIEARAARERLRQRFTNARARVQSELPM